VERDATVFENRPYFDGELLAARLLVALPKAKPSGALAFPGAVGL
jgi:hypothetical protein